jgi:serine/threonine protein kinase
MPAHRFVTLNVPSAGASRGLERVMQVDSDAAREALVSLRGLVAGPRVDGLIRLKHMTHAAPMQLERMGGFDAFWSRAATRQRSGEALAILLARAGLDDASLGAFRSYLDTRTTRGVEASVLSRCVAKLPQTRTFASAADALAAQGYGAPGEQLGKGGNGIVHEVWYQGQPRAMKTDLPGKAKVELKLAGSDPGAKIARGAEVVAHFAQAMQIPHLVQTHHVVVENVRKDLQGREVARRYCILPGGKAFRTEMQLLLHADARARAHDQTRSNWSIDTTIMDKVDGPDLQRLVSSRKPLQIQPEMQKAFVTQAHALLRAAATHGIVLSDLKPGNMFLDIERGVLTVADLGGMSKQSKDSEGQPKLGAYTPAYTLPKCVLQNTMGVEQSLMGMGLSMLKAAAASSGDHAEVEAVTKAIGNLNSEIHDRMKKKRLTRKDAISTWKNFRKKMESELPSLPKGITASPLGAYAIACIQQALRPGKVIPRLDPSDPAQAHPMNAIENAPGCEFLRQRVPG